MPYYNYYCVECDKEELRHIPLVDDVFTEQVLVSSLSQEEIDALPDWDDPRDYEVYKEVKYGDMPPDVVDCHCGGMGERVVDGAPSIKHGRNSYHALKERQRYHHYGMDKKQAEKFYEESCNASRERVKSGEQHYKKVLPNWKNLEKQGLVKRRKQNDASEMAQRLKDNNRVLTKDGTIGKAARKK
mgnify:CR=1 FL=1|tara:strand:- start:79 stop:636 length:558 start_codon:yes stop_codon:yes gene_type:complete